MGLEYVYMCVPWSLVLSQLWWRFRHKGCTVCRHTGPPAIAAFPLPAWAYQATHPAALWDPALSQLVYLFLERGEAWVWGLGTGDTLRPWLYLMPPCSCSVLRPVVVVNSSVW